jgi:hypothetical protein
VTIDVPWRSILRVLTVVVQGWLRLSDWVLLPPLPLEPSSAA